MHGLKVLTFPQNVCHFYRIDGKLVNLTARVCQKIKLANGTVVMDIQKTFSSQSDETGVVLISLQYESGLFNLSIADFWDHRLNQLRLLRKRKIHCVKGKIFWSIPDSNMWLWRSRILEYSRCTQYVTYTWNIRIEYINNSHHLARKYVWIFVRGHYLFREANSFPRAKTVSYEEQIMS